MSHYVYIIATRSGSWLGWPIKIGMTSDPAGRLKSIRTACPGFIEMPYFLDVFDEASARSIEKAMHEQFKLSALNGEWFNVSPTEAAVFLIEYYELLTVGWVFEQGWSREDLSLILGRSGVYGIRERLDAERYTKAWLETAA